MNKIVLGFSGGVDSSVASVLLRERGFDVYGLYLDNAAGRADTPAPPRRMASAL
jgi:tRNA U34 2-thiouridine synthase MnmA/TrmU